MTSFQWIEEYSVNVQEIDDQHKKLISIMEDLYSSIKNSCGDECIKKAVDELVAYTNYHFSTEEKYMEKFSYPAYEEHKREHEAFTAKIAEFKEMANARSAPDAAEILIFLMEWLEKHFLTTDKEYSSLFNENGLR